MTTTVTVKTHGNPALVRLENRIDHSTPEQSTYGHNSTRIFIPKDSTREFVVTDLQTVSSVEELRVQATSLEDAYPVVDLVEEAGSGSARNF
jgi:hypothetical protein